MDDTDGVAIPLVELSDNQINSRIASTSMVRTRDEASHQESKQMYSNDPFLLSELKLLKV
eukprot:scaffold73347_cov51-Attheya_sp.AAC.1